MKGTNIHGYMVDAYHLIDYISKEKPDLTGIEIYIRNHMYPGYFTIPEKDFKERDDKPFHLQVAADEIPLQKA